jgi:hypothetical protein
MSLSLKQKLSIIGGRFLDSLLTMLFLLSRLCLLPSVLRVYLVLLYFTIYRGLID